MADYHFTTARYLLKHPDGTPVILQGLPAISVPLREIFPFAFDEQGNLKQSIPRPQPKKYIYAIREVQTDNVKVGISYDVKVRMAAMQGGSAARLGIVCTWSMDNPEEMEKLLHKRLARHNMHGEWFKLTKNALQGLTTYMKSLGAIQEKYER